MFSDDKVAPWGVGSFAASDKWRPVEPRPLYYFSYTTVPCWQFAKLFVNTTQTSGPGRAWGAKSPTASAPLFTA